MYDTDLIYGNRYRLYLYYVYTQGFKYKLKKKNKNSVVDWTILIRLIYVYKSLKLFH